LSSTKKPPNTRSPVLPAAHKERVVLGFLSRWRAQQHIPIPALLPKLPLYPAFSNTCYKIFHACSVSLEVLGERMLAPSKVVPSTATMDTSKARCPYCPCITCRRLFASWTPSEEQQQQHRC